MHDVSAQTMQAGIALISCHGSSKQNPAVPLGPCYYNTVLLLRVARRAAVSIAQDSGLPFERMMFEFGRFWMPFACEKAGYLEVSLRRSSMHQWRNRNRKGEGQGGNKGPSGLHHT